MTFLFLQANSRTQWITCYTMFSDITSQIDYTITFIDTPGFVGTRCLEHDVKIVSQIRDLFNAKDNKSVATLDAVCFVLPASDSRFTIVQKYLFESILTLFGNDIKNNICTLITFALGQRPAVLTALEALDDKPIPFELYFSFNNSSLYSDSREKHSMYHIFWEMGRNSCSSFFERLVCLKTTSLRLTSDVLIQSWKLENSLSHLQEKIDIALSLIHVFEQELAIFTKYNKEMKHNENFKYEVEEQIMERIDISGQGIYTTTCIVCNYECHSSCKCSNGGEIAKCSAIGLNGHCTVCPKRCNWNNHSKVPYIFKWHTKRVKKTYSDLKDKYDEANKKKISQEFVLNKTQKDIEKISIEMQSNLEKANKYSYRLNQIALRPDPQRSIPLIELLIEVERREKRLGFIQSVETLEKYKKRAKIWDSYHSLEHRLRNIRATV